MGRGSSKAGGGSAASGATTGTTSQGGGKLNLRSERAIKEQLSKMKTGSEVTMSTTNRENDKESVTFRKMMNGWARTRRVNNSVVSLHHVSEVEVAIELKYYADNGGWNLKVKEQ